MRSYFILAMSFLFLIQYFVGSQVLQYVLAIFAAVAFLGSITLAKPTPRFFSIIMFLAGIIFTILKGDGVEAAVQGITANLPLLTLLVFVPLLSIPLKMGGFFDSILLYLKQFQNHPRKLFMGITSVVFFLGPILNIGAIRIVHEFAQKLQLNSTFLSKAYLVGFSTTILWSPYYAAVAITLLYLQVSVTDYIPYGFGLALLFLIIGNLMFSMGSGKQKLETDNHHEETVSTIHGNKVKLLAVIIISLMAATIIAEWITHWSMLVLVSFLAILFPLLWCLFSNQWKSFGPYLIDYRDKSVPFMNNEIIMYISAGFFGHSLTGTSFGQGLSVFMIDLTQISFLLFALFILVTMVVLAYMGIHQVVVVTVLATQMDPVLLGTTKEI